MTPEEIAVQAEIDIVLSQKWKQIKRENIKNTKDKMYYIPILKTFLNSKIPAGSGFDLLLAGNPVIRLDTDPASTILNPLPDIEVHIAEPRIMEVMACLSWEWNMDILRNVWQLAAEGENGPFYHTIKTIIFCSDGNTETEPDAAKWHSEMDEYKLLKKFMNPTAKTGGQPMLKDEYMAKVIKYNKDAS